LLGGNLIQKITAYVAIVCVVFCVALGGSAFLLCEASGSEQIESIFCDNCSVYQNYSGSSSDIPAIYSQDGCVDTVFVIMASLDCGNNEIEADSAESVQCPCCTDILPSSDFRIVKFNDLNFFQSLPFQDSNAPLLS
jgi:hypothetical protein